MMYDKLIRRLRNCAIESAPCKACDMVNDDSCTDRLMKQAADAIEELICDLGDEHTARMDAEERCRWIPVSDHLPDAQDEYLVLWANRADRTARLFYEILEFDGENWVDGIPQADPFGGAEVLYWMPLPELQKEE